MLYMSRCVVIHIHGGEGYLMREEMNGKMTILSTVLKIIVMNLFIISHVFSAKWDFISARKLDMNMGAFSLPCCLEDRRIMLLNNHLT